MGGFDLCAVLGFPAVCAHSGDSDNRMQKLELRAEQMPSKVSLVPRDEIGEELRISRRLSICSAQYAARGARARARS